MYCTPKHVCQLFLRKSTWLKIKLHQQIWVQSLCQELFWRGTEYNQFSLFFGLFLVFSSVCAIDTLGTSSDHLVVRSAEFIRLPKVHKYLNFEWKIPLLAEIFKSTALIMGQRNPQALLSNLGLVVLL